MLALTAKKLFTPLEEIQQPLVLIEGCRIVRVCARSAAEIPRGAQHIDFGDAILGPGFIDIHIHGGMGYDVMRGDEADRALFEKFLVAHGVTGYYPTTVTASIPETLRALERLAKALENPGEEQSEGCARPLGIHLEGPFLSHLRRGVHPVEKLLAPDVKTFERFWEASRGQIRVITIAPELPGALHVISEANRRGVCVSIGHSDATLEQAKAGIGAGARHATHTFNAMRPLGHRDPGIAGEVLNNTGVSADIIADGIHVHPSMIHLFVQAKGMEQAVLITDATAASGMPEGKYYLGALEVEVRDGKCLHDGRLAGSVLTLDRAVQNAMEFAGLDLQRSLRLATLNPARAVNISKGFVEDGAEADLVVLTPAGEVKATMVKGKVVEN